VDYAGFKDHKGICGWFKARCEELGLEVKREVKIGLHRADVVVNDKLIIEVQVTPLPFRKLNDRIESYTGLGYRPIWVLSGNYFAKGYVENFIGFPIKISQLERLIYSGEFSVQKYIYYYGLGWLWRGEPNFHRFKSSLAWINLKRCGFETQIRGMLYD
jgi:competence CoiA-like predicted nuclease